jgi:hypothetical protein
VTDMSRTSTNTRGRILLHRHGLTGPTPAEALPPPVLGRARAPDHAACGAGNGRPGSEITASSVESRRRKANANHVGIQRMLRQYRYFMASGRLMTSGIPPAMT